MDNKKFFLCILYSLLLRGENTILSPSEKMQLILQKINEDIRYYKEQRQEKEREYLFTSAVTFKEKEGQRHRRDITQEETLKKGEEKIGNKKSCKTHLGEIKISESHLKNEHYTFSPFDIERLIESHPKTNTIAKKKEYTSFISIIEDFVYIQNHLTFEKKSQKTGTTQDYNNTILYSPENFFTTETTISKTLRSIPYKTVYFLAKGQDTKRIRETKTSITPITYKQIKSVEAFKKNIEDEFIKVEENDSILAMLENELGFFGESLTTNNTLYKKGQNALANFFSGATIKEEIILFLKALTAIFTKDTELKDLTNTLALLFKLRLESTEEREKINFILEKIRENIIKKKKNNTKYSDEAYDKLDKNISYLLALREFTHRVSTRKISVNENTASTLYHYLVEKKIFTENLDSTSYIYKQIINAAQKLINNLYDLLEERKTLKRQIINYITYNNVLAITSANQCKKVFKYRHSNKKLSLRASSKKTPSSVTTTTLNTSFSKKLQQIGTKIKDNFFYILSRIGFRENNL